MGRQKRLFQRILLIAVSSILGNVLHAQSFRPGDFRVLTVGSEIPVYADADITDLQQIGTVSSSQILQMEAVHPELLSFAGFKDMPNRLVCFIQVRLPNGHSGWILDDSVLPVPKSEESTLQLFQSKAYHRETGRGLDIWGHLVVASDGSFYWKFFWGEWQRSNFVIVESEVYPVENPFVPIEAPFGDDHLLSVVLDRESLKLKTFHPQYDYLASNYTWDSARAYNGRDWPRVQVLQEQTKLAIQNRDKARLEQLVRDHGDYFANLHQRSGNMSTSIIYALVKNRDFEMLDMLLDLGVSPLIPTGDYDGVSSPIYQAVGLRDYEMVQFLSDKGIAFGLGKVLSFTESELDRAISLKDQRMVALLIELGADVTSPRWSMSNGAFDGGTSFRLHNAILSGEIEIVRLILDAGADPNQFSNGFGHWGTEVHRGMRAPFNLAEGEIRELLVEYGAKDPAEMSLAEFADMRLAPVLVITDDRVRFRSAPILEDNNILGVFSKDTRVRMLYVSEERMQIGNENHTWVLVEDRSGNIGWVYGQYLNPEHMYQYVTKDEFLAGD